ncbi:hypothetical protein NTE_02723 [Candidatus Nitrososphaera evergladensis SR1]|jgi:hypothetical protein|uniref:Uncharacterized protein n=1 Tax=Candidatus Nitrososphaera evergladensis SR1 TaxID=1459636 RepID=A0A075MUA8_9ARCH|nr:hypothetical protein [Candidatus Nitrososphaera evergladensis]AIF84765.1 hypothetical protein NTE_02723 [Candidatus Nitrososphaera evergladensis SR1]
MSHRPKPVRDHYTESLAVNSENLGKQLSAESVPREQVQKILDSISRLYLAETEKIVHECEKDMMALERVPSPLRLFIDSIAQVMTMKSNAISPAAFTLLKRYASAWEDWM